MYKWRNLVLVAKQTVPEDTYIYIYIYVYMSTYYYQRQFTTGAILFTGERHYSALLQKR